MFFSPWRAPASICLRNIISFTDGVSLAHHHRPQLRLALALAEQVARSGVQAGGRGGARGGHLDRKVMHSCMGPVFYKGIGWQPCFDGTLSDSKFVVTYHNENGE